MFIITEHELYSGVGNLFDLLRQITDMQISMARHANPLTGLPGNVPINEHLTEAIENNLTITVCYIDLDSFEPYNDIYGYAKGDNVIRTTANILTKEVDTECDFVGHVGGDDFIIIFESADWEARCRRIMSTLTAAHRSFYHREHLMKGGMYSIDRYGQENFYSLLTMSVGAVHLRDFEIIGDQALLAEYASKAKSISKCQAGNSLYQLKPDDLSPKVFSNIA